MQLYENEKGVHDAPGREYAFGNVAFRILMNKCFEHRDIIDIIDILRLLRPPTTIFSPVQSRINDYVYII